MYLLLNAQFAAEWAVCLATRSQRYNRKMARIVLVHSKNIGLSTICYGYGALRLNTFLSKLTELDLLSLSMFGMYVLHVFATLLLRRQLSWCVGVCLLNKLLPSWASSASWLLFLCQNMQYKMANENYLHFKSVFATLFSLLGVLLWSH